MGESGAGTDVRALEQLLWYTFSSNQALTRAPFSNMVPDYMVAGPDFRAKGYGGVLALGRWDHAWRWAPEAAHMRCSFARRPRRRAAACATG